MNEFVFQITSLARLRSEGFEPEEQAVCRESASTPAESTLSGPAKRLCIATSQWVSANRAETLPKVEKAMLLGIVAGQPVRHTL